MGKGRSNPIAGAHKNYTCISWSCNFAGLHPALQLPTSLPEQNH